MLHTIDPRSPVSALKEHRAPGHIGACAVGDDVKTQVSFEFFPPNDEAGEARLWDALVELSPLAPSFVSVTYGAGGSTRSRTRDVLARILAETDLAPAAHLTCVAATQAEVDEVAHDFWDLGIRHIVALRGDPPEGIRARYEPHPGGYGYASDLVAGLRRIADFEISVGVYPELHPESSGWGDEIDNLKRKVDAGASRGITQFFFDVDAFLRFMDRVRSVGVTIPIVPGVMPVVSFKGLQRMAKLCGATTPDWLVELFEGLDDRPETRALVSAAVTAELCARLKSEGFHDFHFYTLNRPALTAAACQVLGARRTALAAAA